MIKTSAPYLSFPLSWIVPFSGNGFNDDILAISPVLSMRDSTNAGLITLSGSTLASATTTAHELGHMFGLNHDSDRCIRLSISHLLLMYIKAHNLNSFKLCPYASCNDSCVVHSSQQCPC